ncbi:MAG: Do family serine endopeptidase [Desulfovibrionaceae bacterium]|nr:Do family serine endopeptidase [Desulfovibrionaceae bacterium]
MLQMIRKTSLALMLCAVFALTAVAAPAPDSFAPIAAATGKAVVNISTEKHIQGGTQADMFRGLPPEFEQFFRFFEGRGNRAPRTKRSLGTGFIISSDGYIVTNNHVVAGADTVLINLQGTNGKDESLPAKIIGSDAETDLALLKVQAPQKLPYLEFGDSDRSEVGEWVLAIGNPFGLGHTVTAGILSAKGRDIRSGPYDNYLQTDASINPGNSGGPLIDLNGRVIGINTAIIASGQGIGFAIPSNMASQIIAQLRDHKRVDRGWLGVTIQDMDSRTARAMGLDPQAGGVLIASVLPGQPAEKAGLRSGDVVLEVNGMKVTDQKTFMRAIATSAPGSGANLKIWRNGRTERRSVTLGTRNSENLQAESGLPARKNTSEYTSSALGLTVQEAKGEKARQTYGSEGMVVVNVEQGKPAAESGIAPGDLIVSANLDDVRTVRQFEAALKGAAKRKAVLFQIVRRGQTFFRTLEMK